MDDLLDLDFAAKPSAQPAKPSAQSAYGNGTAFDYLAQQSAHRASSPAFTTPLQPSRTPTPNARPLAATASQTSGGDAFANLFGTSPATAAQNGDKGLSMAERLHKESAAKIGGYGGLSAAGTGGSAYAGLGSLAGGGGSRACSPALQPPSRGASPASSLLSPTSASSRPLSPSTASSSLSSGAAKSSDTWNFDLLGSTVSAASTSKPAVAAKVDPFDLGFDTLPASSSAPPPPTKPSTNGTAAPADDFDLLDAFASPAPPVASRPSPSPSPAPPSSARPPPARSASPPPHILGHLVEMGFSPSAARSALASTANPSTGEFDVERAVDVLMGGSGAAPPAQPRRQEEEVVDERERRRREKQKRDEDEWGEEDNVRVGRRRSWEFEGDDDERKERERMERRRRADAAAAEQGQASSSAPPASKPSRSRDAASPSSAASAAAADPNDPAAQLQQQATAALASAQKFGFSVMKSANSFFGQAREAALKAVEEQRAAARAKAGLPPAAGGAGSADGAVPGRPKWWREGMNEEGVEGKGKGREEEPPATSFKDSDDEGGDPVLQKRPPPRQQQQPQRQAPPPAAAPAPTEYRSPFRRAKAALAAATPPPAPAEADLLSGAPAPPAPSRSPALAPSRSPVPSSSVRASPSPRPTPSNYRPRPSVTISPSALSTAIKHKTAGNEHFKLGRFGEASASYSAALEALPAGWVGRVLLLNNRAQSRLRSGEEKAAVEDCTEGLDILLSVFDPPTLASVDLPSLSTESSSLPPPVLELAGSSAVDLKDHLGKALGRRAKAYEGVEKWAAAAADWEAVLKLGDETVVKGAGGRKMVNEGAARCRKMLGGPSSTATSSSSAPRPTASSAVKPKPAAAASRPRPPPTPVEGSGDAVRALQASRAAADAEDDARHALKDTVDAKILAWKGGKETNLRALIASLENVLWPELGWKKVGMHELVTENGLKVRYVRAIAKMHPDKLNVNNTTVEQRMIAGLVFAALNDAWNSMK